MRCETAVFAEPLAAACEILDQVSIPCSSQIAVLGDGKLGLLVAQVLNAHGFKVHQFGRHAEKLRIAESAWLSERGDKGRSPWRRWASQARTSPAVTPPRSASEIASPRCCSRKPM